jgi:hypothetical protein
MVQLIFCQGAFQTAHLHSGDYVSNATRIGPPAVED